MGGDPGSVGARIGDALRAACGPAAPRVHAAAGVLVAVTGGHSGPLRPELREHGAGGAAAGARATGATGVDDLVLRLFREQGASLVRLARLFVDDRNAAEDLVQEAFIRLARNGERIRDPDKAPAYLRSIVLNLARDHNRRGLVSLRHHLPSDAPGDSTEDHILLTDDRRRVLEALRDLPLRQRSCLVLRYYEELGVDEIAEVLGISRNSVKTHLSRGLAGMEARL